MFLQLPVPAVVYFCPYSQSGRIFAGWSAWLTLSWSWDVIRKQSLPGLPCALYWIKGQKPSCFSSHGGFIFENHWRKPCHFMHSSINAGGCWECGSRGETDEEVLGLCDPLWVCGTERLSKCPAFAWLKSTFCFLAHQENCRINLIFWNNGRR